MSLLRVFGPGVPTVVGCQMIIFQVIILRGIGDVIINVIVEFSVNIIISRPTYVFKLSASVGPLSSYVPRIGVEC